MLKVMILFIQSSLCPGQWRSGLSHVSRLLLFTGFCITGLGSGLVQAESSFTPPQGYSQERYEEGWKRNPFTLRTAPVAVTRDSFAKDLVLHNSYSIGDKRTVILANTKTRERIRLTSDTAAPDGMVLKSYNQGGSRKEAFVVLEHRGETATVRYDDNFIKQMATAAPRATKSTQMDQEGESIDNPDLVAIPPPAPPQQVVMRQNQTPMPQSPHTENAKRSSQPPIPNRNVNMSGEAPLPSNTVKSRRRLTVPQSNTVKKP